MQLGMIGLGAELKIAALRNEFGGHAVQKS